MTTRSWTPSLDDNAANPLNWSPTGAPQPGDDLIWANGGTMEVADDALAGDRLEIGGPPSASPQDFVLDVTGKAHFTEAAEFPPFGIGSITINLADHAKWIGGFSSNLGGGVFITGQGKFYNQASFVAAKSVVDVDVPGNGTFRVGSAQSVPGVLEFTRSVGHGQSITIAGDRTRGVTASLLVDDPAHFHADTTLGFGEISLAGLVADSYSIRNDMLLLYSGCRVVDRLDLTVSPSLFATNFGVSQTDKGVVVHADFNEPGTPLPLHS
jgi:hypothetical protein